MARFDWYQATVGGTVPDIRACLGELVDRPVWEPQRRPKQGYGFADHLVGQDGTACMLWWGGTHPLPHVVLSGADAHEGAALLRARWPEEHAVSRADACIDYVEPGAYDLLQGLALQVAEEDKIKVGTAGDHLMTMKGRTVYLGAASSHTRLRIYDKAEQLRGVFAKDPARLATVPADLARFECQVRPQSQAARYQASKADPLALMGSARWMRKLMGMVAGVELEPWQAGKVWRQSDDDRAYASVLAQYGGLFKRIVGDLGSWECLGKQIGADLEERASLRVKGR